LLLNQAGLPKDLVLYLARHECGTKICREKGIEFARRLLGHSDISTTQRSVHLKDGAPGRPGVGRGPGSGKLTGAEYVLFNLTQSMSSLNSTECLAWRRKQVLRAQHPDKSVSRFIDIEYDTAARLAVLRK
jgi:hypothetical protein